MRRSSRHLLRYPKPGAVHATFWLACRARLPHPQEAPHSARLYATCARPLTTLTRSAAWGGRSASSPAAMPEMSGSAAHSVTNSPCPTCTAHRAGRGGCCKIAASRSRATADKHQEPPACSTTAPGGCCQSRGRVGPATDQSSPGLRRPRATDRALLTRLVVHQVLCGDAAVVQHPVHLCALKPARGGHIGRRRAGRGITEFLWSQAARRSRQ